jgi:hypothetical protein
VLPRSSENPLSCLCMAMAPFTVQPCISMFHCKPKLSSMFTYTLVKYHLTGVLFNMASVTRRQVTPVTCFVDIVGIVPKCCGTIGVSQHPLYRDLIIALALSISTSAVRQPYCPSKFRFAEISHCASGRNHSFVNSDYRVAASFHRQLFFCLAQSSNPDGTLLSCDETP